MIELYNNYVIILLYSSMDIILIIEYFNAVLCYYGLNGQVLITPVNYIILSQNNNY